MKNLILLFAFLYVSNSLFSQEKISFEKNKEKSISILKRQNLKAMETLIATDNAITDDQLFQLVDLFSGKDGMIDYILSSDKKSMQVFHLDYVSTSSVVSMFTKSKIESHVEKSSLSTSYVYN